MNQDSCSSWFAAQAPEETEKPETVYPLLIWGVVLVLVPAFYLLDFY